MVSGVGPELVELNTLAEHGEQPFLDALARAVAFGRRRAGDVRSILAAGALPLLQNTARITEPGRDTRTRHTPWPAAAPERHKDFPDFAEHEGPVLVGA